MTHRTIATAIALACALTASTVASAQTGQRPPTTTPPKQTPPKTPAKPKKPRQPITLFLTVGEQIASNGFGESLSFPFNGGETATITGPVKFSHAPHVEGGVAFQLKPRFTIGARLGFYRGTGSVDASFHIPHPFFFNQARNADGNGAALRQSFDVDLELTFVLFTNKQWRVDALVGPGFSTLTQQLAVDSLTYDETYPYDSITLRPSGTTAGHHGSAVAFHAGVRVSRPLTKKLSLMFEFRYRQFSISPTVAGASQKLPTKTPTAGAGIKYVF